MKIKVLKSFRDKHSGKVHKAGSTLTVTKERYDEIVKKDKNLVEEVKKTEKATKTAE